MRRALAILALAALAHAGSAVALELAGVRVPAQATVAGQSLVLNGAGIRTKLVFKVYVASLYVPQKASTAEAVLASAPRRVRLDLLRNLSAAQFVDALKEGLADNNSPEALAAVQREVDELVQVMQAIGEVHDGTVITLDFADGVTTVSQDGVPRGSIAGDAFNQALLRIWLGEHPVQANLRRAMLGA